LVRYTITYNMGWNGVNNPLNVTWYTVEDGEEW
jgi:hypothetical protein